MSRVIAGVLAAACALIATSAVAGTRSGNFAVEQAGLTSCANYEKARAAKSDNYLRYIGFVEGYLTAANRYEPNTFDLTPWHTPEAFALILNQHCRANAQDTLVKAVQKIVLAMQPLKLSESSRIIQLTEGKNRTYVYEAVLQRAQSELGKKGLYKGQADGRFTPAVMTALAQFQRSAKLEPTGLPDPATLWVLLNP